MKRTLITLTAAMLTGTTALAAGPDAVAKLQGPDGADMGQVTIRQTEHGVLFHAEAKGLSEGWHGFHVHETGSCADGFKAAGDHYAPDGNKHGLMNEDGAHAGDLPNIHADANGDAWAEFHSARLSVEGADAPLMDADGSAIVIHAEADSYQSDAGAGDRAACGVVQKAR